LFFSVTLIVYINTHDQLAIMMRWRNNLWDHPLWRWV